MSKSLVKKLSLILVTLIAVGGLFVFMFSGDNFDILKKIFDTNVNEEEFKELLQSFGYKGVITIGLLSMLQVVVTVMPAEPVQVLAGVTYGLGWGVLICWTGVLLGNSLIYLLYKLLGDKLSNYFKKNIDVDFDNIKVTKRLSIIVFVLYFLPAIPYGLICFFSASLGLKYPRYITLTMLGSLPSVLIGVGMGHLAVATSWIISLIVLGVLLILILVLFLFRKKLFKKVNGFIHKQQLKASRSWMVKKPKWWAFPAAKLVIKHFRRKVKFKVTKQTEIKGPSIVLCSHGSFLDFVYALSVLYKEKPHFIIARLYFYKNLFNRTLRAGGAFPKSLFAADVENVKNCISVLKDGKILAMMPEAHLSTVGKFEGIHDSTLKFIKKMGVDVYAIRINGSYFAKPKWGDKIRKGSPVEAEFVKILTAEQVNSISVEELYQNIKNAIYYDDFEWIDKNYPTHLYHHKNIAKGLENILYKCPNCGGEFTIETNGREVYCSKCSYKEIVNERYAFDDQTRFKNYAEWYDYTIELLRKEIIANPDYALTDNVTLKMRSKNGRKLLDVVGEGVCTLNRNGFSYQGTINGETVRKEFSMKNMAMLLYGAGEDFEIYENTDIYYFVPAERKSCVKWHLASVILKELSEQN